MDLYAFTQYPFFMTPLSIPAGYRLRTKRLNSSRLVSHRQDNTELRLATHHASVSLRRFFERIGFEHGTHAGQFGEVHRVLGIRSCPHRRALDGTLSGDGL